MYDKIKKETIENMFGEWESESFVKYPNISVKINLTKDRLSIIIKKDDLIFEEVSISSNAHWINKFLSFTEKQRFVVFEATKSEMLFGELEMPGYFNSAYKWQFKFNRITS